MKQQSRNFTLIELIVVLSIIAILGTILYSLFSRRRTVDNSQAVKHALAFGQKMAIDRDLSRPDAVECSLQSTSADGRVSCTYTYVTEKGNRGEFNLRCDLFENGNCKVSEGVNPIQIND